MSKQYHIAEPKVKSLF